MNKQIICLLILAIASLSYAQVIDPNTRSNPANFYTKFIQMDWHLDLLEKTLRGTSEITLVAIKGDIKEVILDVWNELDIEQSKCFYSDSIVTDKQVACVVDNSSTTQELQGYALKITLDAPQTQNHQFKIKVSYFIDNEDIEIGQTGSMAIKFSDYEVSASRKFPSAFSHSQMIYARSLGAFQDSPNVRFNWSANVVVTPNVSPSGFVMSGYQCGDKPKETPDNITFCYSSGSTPYPSYSIAFLAGDLKQKDVLGTNMKIITFNDWMDEGYEYLAESGQYLAALSRYLGGADYPFDEINVAIPPIDFPYSSMDNGNLIFISKSVIPQENNMGDELGHFVLTKALAKAWFGHTQGIANWQSFWLTEGISTFVARQAIKQIYDFNYETNNLVGNQSYFGYVSEVMATQGLESEYLELTPDSTGIDPYRALNPLIREKTNQLLEHIQYFAMNPGYMQDFLIKWATNPKVGNKTNNTVQTYTTDDFKESLDDFIRDTYAYPETVFAKIDFDHWVNGRGMPKQQYQEELLSLWMTPATQEVLFLAEQVVELRGVGVPKRFLTVAKFWSPNNNLLFLSYIQNNINNIRRSRFDYRLFKTIDQLLDLQNHRAIEVRTTFIQLALRTEYIHNVLPSLAKLLVSTGNLEIILPIYQTLVDVGLRETAKQLYDQGKKYYHPIAVRRIQSVLNQP